ncbi:WGR domain-containing protein [Methylocystis echinoides]|nr:WGR domain-containing protein [Methylocystis echinoides]
MFGGVLLMKEWARIGTPGRVAAERFKSEALAGARRQAERKKGKGYS